MLADTSFLFSLGHLLEAVGQASPAEIGITELGKAIRYVDMEVVVRMRWRDMQATASGGRASRGR